MEPQLSQLKLRYFDFCPKTTKSEFTACKSSSSARTATLRNASAVRYVRVASGMRKRRRHATLRMEAGGCADGRCTLDSHVLAEPSSRRILDCGSQAKRPDQITKQANGGFKEVWLGCYTPNQTDPV